MSGSGLCKARFHPGRIGHVAGNGDSAYITGHALRGCCVAVHHRNPRAIGCQTPRHSLAQTRACAGYDGGHSCTLHIFASLQ